jgi:hydroxymethylpyrimidine kinase/phosphomethylpyrimidine kinase
VTGELHQPRPIVLTIAGFDPSGGAGIVADILAIQAVGCKAVAAITSITFQNSGKYSGALHQSAESVRAQVEPIASEHAILAEKIGMLPTAEVVHEVARLIGVLKLPRPVIDPVMESTSGAKLMSDEAFEVFVTELLPLARVVTPNISEAEKLSGMNIHEEEEMRQAAARIRELGAHAVLIKGGHLRGERSGLRGHRSERGSSPSVREGPNQAIDVLDDGGQVTVFRSEWIDAPNVRGTGCLLSSAIACGLARGDELKQAVATAKDFVTETIKNSKFRIQN